MSSYIRIEFSNQDGQWFTDFDLVLVRGKVSKPNRFLFKKRKFWVCFDLKKIKSEHYHIWLSHRPAITESLFEVDINVYRWFFLTHIIQLHVKAWSFFFVGWINFDIRLLFLSNKTVTIIKGKALSEWVWWKIFNRLGFYFSLTSISTGDINNKSYFLFSLLIDFEVK